MFSAKSARAELQSFFHFVAVIHKLQVNMTTNRAAWLTEPKAYPFQIKEAPFPMAGPGEVAIRNVVTALVSCVAAMHKVLGD